MAILSQKEVKVLIELCTDLEEADKVINDYYGFKTIEEKVAFLKGMFDVRLIGHEHDEPDENTYRMMLYAIIKAKWH